MDLARELHRPVIKKFQTRKIMTKGLDHIWEADLLIMRAYSRQNKGFKYILNVIDCFSRYAWSIPLKDKTGKQVTEAFTEILKSSRRKPELLHADRGKEFVNSTFLEFLKKQKIKMYHTFSTVKAAMVERFNRTLNEKLKLHFEVNKNHNWLTLLPTLLQQYNEQDHHRSIGTTPSQVSRKNEKEIYDRLYSVKNFKVPKPTFKVGDRVRIITKNAIFSNKYEQKWSTEIFTITKVHYTVPITYTIKGLNDDENIDGKFYKNELQKTKF